MPEDAWRPAPHLDRLQRREWVGEAFVFDPFSGQTHVLNAMALRVLDLIRAAPRTQNELLDLLQRGLDPAERANLAAILPSHLELLADMGLILAPDDQAPDLYDPSGCPA